MPSRPTDEELEEAGKRMRLRMLAHRRYGHPAHSRSYPVPYIQFVEDTAARFMRRFIKPHDCVYRITSKYDLDKYIYLDRGHIHGSLYVTIMEIVWAWNKAKLSDYKYPPAAKAEGWTICGYYLEARDRSWKDEWLLRKDACHPWQEESRSAADRGPPYHDHSLSRPWFWIYNHLHGFYINGILRVYDPKKSPELYAQIEALKQMDMDLRFLHFSFR